MVIGIHSRGNISPEFNRDIHVIEPFEIPVHWRRYRAIDYGLDMLACYWIAVDRQRKSYVYKELYQDNLIISDAAKAILRVNGNDNIYATLHRQTYGTEGRRPARVQQTYSGKMAYC